MNKKIINDYIKELGGSKILIDRAKEIYEIHKIVCPQEIKTIFISEYHTKDKTRIFDNLWFFSDSFFMETKNFQNNNNTDLIRFQKNIDYIEMFYQDFDFKKGNDNSNLTIKMMLGGTDLFAQFKASKQNCDNLMNIYSNFFKSNVRVTPA